MTESNCDPVKRGLRQGLKGFETRPWAGQTCGLRGRHGLCRVQRRREPQGPSAFERQGAGAADFGGMVEWFKAPVLKTGVGASSPWVRIPLPPPLWRSRPRSGLRGGAALAAGRVQAKLGSAKTLPGPSGRSSKFSLRLRHIVAHARHGDAMLRMDRRSAWAALAPGRVQAKLGSAKMLPSPSGCEPSSNLTSPRHASRR